MSKKGEENGQNRRQFLSTLALGAVGTAGITKMLGGCSSPGLLQEMDEQGPPAMEDQAPDGEPLKAGLVGCGGRGTGAAINFVDAGPNLEVVALADVFEDQLNNCREHLKGARGIEIADDHCFSGLDGYKKLLETDIDIVLMASPPNFRPVQVEAAIHADKHIFQEKPVAVDPVGARKMDRNTQLAREKGLCMVSGTIRRYQRDYIATYDRVQKGAIGEVTGATIIRNGGALWWVERKPEWSDLEYMLRNWGNYLWLSGDHIVEMFIHEVDVMNWFMGDHPVRATGYGGRSQRAAGDLYDHFSFSLDYDRNRRVHCAVRQIDGCDNGKEELIQGTEGSADAAGVIYDKNGERIWSYPHPRDRDPDQSWAVPSPYVQEHVELVKAIRTGNYINDSDEQVKSTRIGIMATMAAYTGRDITWEEVLESDLDYGLGNLSELSFASSYEIPGEVARPGVQARAIERYG